MHIPKIFHNLVTHYPLLLNIESNKVTNKHNRKEQKIFEQQQPKTINKLTRNVSFNCTSERLAINQFLVEYQNLSQQKQFTQKYQEYAENYYQPCSQDQCLLNQNTVTNLVLIFPQTLIITTPNINIRDHSFIRLINFILRNLKGNFLHAAKTWKINSSVSIDSHLFDQKYEKVSKLMKKAKYTEAIDIIQSTLPFSQPSQQLKQMYLWLAMAHINSGNSSECIKVLTVIIQLFPDFQEAYLYRARIYNKLNRQKEATNDLETILKINPRNIQAYIDWGNNQKQRGKLDKAIQIWNFGRIKLQSMYLSKLIVQNKIKMRKFQEVQKQMQQLSIKSQKNSSDLLYLYGLYEKEKSQLNEACIFFQQAIKYNNSEVSVCDSLENLLKIRIQQRDYYSAFHAASRMEFLKINSKKLSFYKNFLEAVILIMKKKFNDGVAILQKDVAKEEFKKVDSFLKPLYYKFLGFAYFKVGKHINSAQAFYKLNTIDSSAFDDVSRYNLCLAEGVRAVDQMGNYELGYKKFTQAKGIFPKKVEPYIYVAVTMLKQKLKLPENKNKRTSLIQLALSQLNKGQTVNPSSSNLLFHRTILHLALENWDLAHNDINKCIQKAQQNLPKYFYIRGICYACLKDFGKSVNQYSIAISLDNQYNLAYLERAKSEFLSGESDSGFRDLKYYMQLNPNDLKVHKWIGDLLYEGKSYDDAIRAYSEFNDKNCFQLFQMRAKCYFRLGKLDQVKICLRNMQKIEIPLKYCKLDKTVEVDFISLRLLNSLLKNDGQSTIITHIKHLNKYLQLNKTGFVFQLIDCMNLLGVAAFYLGKYDQAYQSFMLTLELYQSFSTKESLDLKSQVSQEEVNLQLDKIIYNMFLCQAILGEEQKAFSLLEDDQIIESCSKFEFGKQFSTIIEMVSKGQQNLLVLQPNHDSVFKQLKAFQIKLFNLKIKTRLFFGLYHESPDELFCTQVAKSKINDLCPSYIDNNPEGPWIKRNQHGVIFTQQIIENQGSEWVDSSKHATNRLSEIDKVETVGKNDEDQSSSSEEDFLNERQRFKEMMKLDANLENRLKKVLKKSSNTD